MSPPPRARHAARRRRRPLTAAALSLSSRCRLLDQGAASEAQLWALARVMEAEELEAAAEERSLAGACGWPLCAAPLPPARGGGGRYAIDARAQKVYELGEGARFCSTAHADAARALSARLGDRSAAAARFERLYDAARAHRAAAAAAAAGGAAAATAPPGAKPRGGAEFAAGSRSTPIMRAEVVERAGGAGGAAAPRPPAAGAAGAVEGYVPRAALKQALPAGAAPREGAPDAGRRVRFEDEAAEAPVAAAEPAAPLPLPAPPGGAAPAIVFDVVDAAGPLEGAGDEALAASFGQLRVEVPAGAPGAPHARAPPPPTPLDEELTARLRAGAHRLFPKLTSTLPPELLARLEADASGSEAASEDEGEGAGWTDAESSSSDGEAPGGRRAAMTFFGELFTCLECWSTESTLELTASGPGAPLPAAPPGGLPEVRGALGRLLRAQVPAAMEALGAPARRGDAEHALDEAVATLRGEGPLPAFKAAQWRVLALVLLKAASLERCPELRAALESREGVGRLGAALAAASFTVEEFYAVLELVVRPG